MVKFIVSGEFDSQQAKGVPGLASFYFSGGAEVISSTSKKYVVKLDPSAGIPTIPGITLPSFGENSPDQWFGKGLKYKDITLKGHTIEVPYKGVLKRYLDKNDDYRVEVTGLKIDADDFFRVSSTFSNKDNLALNRKIFSKDDLIKGGSVKDELNGFNGDDIVQGRGGNDKLSGGNGNDTLSGGKGTDKFIFKGKFGKDVITDFAAKNSNEDIDLSGVKPISSFKDLSANHMSQKGDDVLIKAGKDSIRLESVDISDLGANDFIF